ncbi:hypothetical protein Daudx_0431 [Candidatus Desulforudis audaxviator]|nr:hypothetical protein Daudx_0431 [Candidatus Desulforudis audaxviator]
MLFAVKGTAEGKTHVDPAVAGKSKSTAIFRARVISLLFTL